jgi:hypothetical protein
MNDFTCKRLTGIHGNRGRLFNGRKSEKLAAH